MTAKGGWVEDKSEGPRDRGGGCNWKVSWEEEKSPEVKRRKDGKKWDIGELGTGSQGWLPRLLMNNRVKYTVSWLRLNSNSRAQSPPTIMRELTTQRNVGMPLPWSISKNDALIMSLYDFAGDTSGKEPAYQCRRLKRCGFDHWVGKVPWRSKWQPTPVFLPGEFHGQSSLVGYSPWGHKDSDTTEATYRMCIHEEQRVPWHSNKEAKNKYGAKSLAGFKKDNWVKQTFFVASMIAVRFFNTRGPSEVYLKLTALNLILASLLQGGGGWSLYSQGASSSRSKYSITLSTEIIWKTHDIMWVRTEGLVYRCSEIVNEMFCFYI